MTRRLRKEERLAAAAEIGDAAEVKRLIASGANVNWCDEDGATALILACRNRAMECIPLLLDANADTNIADSKYHATPLIDSCLNNDLPAALLLLQRAANPNKRGCFESLQSPIEIAAYKCNHLLFEALLAAGATPPSQQFAEDALKSIIMMPAVEMAKMYIKMIKLLNIDLSLARQSALNAETSNGFIAASMLEAELLDKQTDRSSTIGVSVHNYI